MAQQKQALGPNQTAWLEALESGLYSQGQGYLKTARGYCCLGVACEVLLGAPTGSNKTLHDETCATWNGSFGYPPIQIVEMLGLYDERGTPSRIEGVPFALTDLNDNCEKTFKEIAATVRNDPSMYFKEPK